MTIGDDVLKQPTSLQKSFCWYYKIWQSKPTDCPLPTLIE